MRGERVSLSKSRIVMAVQSAFVWGLATGAGMVGTVYFLLELSLK